MGFLPILVFIIIIAITSAQKKAGQEAAARRRQSGQQFTPPPPRPATSQRGRPNQPARAQGQPDYRKQAAPRTGVDAGRVLQNVDRRVQSGEQSTRNRSFEQNSGRRDPDFTETSSAADVKYTTQGCGCDSRGNATGGRGHGRSNAMYDEAQFFQEAQEMRRGNWT